MHRRTAYRKRTSPLAFVTRHAARRIALVVLVATLALDAVVLVPGYARIKERFVADMRRESAELFQGAVDPTRYPSLSSLVGIGENLTGATMVAGGTYVTGIGEEKARFGEPPSLTWADARLEGEETRVWPDFSRIEVFLGPEVTRTSYGVVLLLDTGPRWATVASRTMDLVVLAVVAALALTLVVYSLVAFQVVRPVRAIRRAVDAALDDPEAATAQLSRVGQGDEIGGVSRAVDQLVFLAATAFGDELAAAEAIAHRAPHALLTFSEHGHLLAANAAALELLGADGLETLLRRAPDRLFRFEGKRTTAAALLADGRAALGPGELIGEATAIPCLVGGDVVRRPDGSVLRMFLMFVDMRRIVQDMRDQVLRREQAEAATQRMEAEIGRMRGRFDACLVLMELDGANAPPRVAPVTVDLARLAQGWHERAVELDAMSDDGLTVGELPLVLGDPSETRRMLAMMLETVLQRSSVEKPRLAIAARMADAEAAELTVYETSATGEELIRPIGSEDDATLLVSAAAVLARRQGGAVTATRTAEGGNAMSCTLQVDEATMALEEETRLPRETVA